MQLCKTVYKCWSGGYRVCQRFSTTRGTTIPGISLSQSGYQMSQDTKETHRQHGGVGSSHAGSGGTNKTSNKLEFDINHPLKHTLKNVFDKGGKMILIFPAATQIIYSTCQKWLISVVITLTDD